MKICMLVTNSLKKDPRVQREAETAYAAGFDVTVIGCDDSNYDEEFINSRPYNVWIYRLDMKYRASLKRDWMKLMRMWLPIYNLYKKCLELKPDVIHANDFDTLPAAFFAAKRLKCAVVYDSHEIYSGQPQLVGRKIIKRAIEKIEGYMIKRVDEVLSVSNAAAEVLSDMYGIATPTVITNTSFKVESAQLPEKNDGFEVVYQGIMSAHRGYEEFVQSASLVDENIRMIIRGFGPIEKKLRETVKANGLEDKVKFAEPVEVKELIPMAARSCVGVVLTVPVSDNFKYTVSNKIFEYVQARIPVILSDVPEHRYINDKYNIGIVVDEVTPEKIAEAINTLYRDKEKYEMFKKNVVAAAEQLCWENEGKRLVNAYNRVSKR